MWWPSLYLSSCVLLPHVAFAFTGDRGNVAVVEDTTGAIHETEGFWGPDQLCRETAKVFFRCHGDEYDGLVVFTSKPVAGFEDMIRNVAQGTPVKVDFDGVGYNRYNQTALYGSAGRLEHCVSMASLGALPDDPDGATTAFLGLPLGLTGVELVGHEYGHHWLIGVTFDKNDGNGPQHLLRGFEGGGGTDPNAGSPNLHYNYYSDSHSVMYGNFLTDLGGGQFRACGGDRKYSELDQYLMGLRAPVDVSPMMVLDDGSHQGSAAVAIPKGTCNEIQGTFTRVDVAIEDVIRSMGARVPPAGESKTHWRIAFVLATENGQGATTAQVTKVDRYRARFQQWFPGATDSRGTVDTTLGPWTCGDGGAAPLDGGVGPKPPEDGGSPADAGASPNDAGITPPQDAGAPFGDDAGAEQDGGQPRRDAGVSRRDPVVGCSCDIAQAGSPVAWLWALAAAVILCSRRGRHFP